MYRTSQFLCCDILKPVYLCLKIKRKTVSLLKLPQYLTQILLLEALKANRCDYVRVLLDQGVNFDRRFLPELYEQVCIDDKCYN